MKEIDCGDSGKIKLYDIYQREEEAKPSYEEFYFVDSRETNGVIQGPIMRFNTPSELSFDNMVEISLNAYNDYITILKGEDNVSEPRETQGQTSEGN